MPTQHVHYKATHFLSSRSLGSSVSTNNSSLLVCLFNYFVLSYHLSSLFVAFYLSGAHSARLSLSLSLSFGLVQVTSPPGANLAVIDPLISSALECQRNKTVVLTAPIKLMMVIKKHTCIICAVDVSNGRQLSGMDPSLSDSFPQSRKWTNKAHSESLIYLTRQFITYSLSFLPGDYRSN